MKPLHFTLSATFIIGLLGGLSSQFFFSDQSKPESPGRQTSASPNPFQISEEPTDLRTQITDLQQRVSQLEQQLENVMTSQSISEENAAPAAEKSIVQNRTVTPNRESLIEAGIDPDIAEDILRRMSQQEYRRLELQNLMSRSSASERRIYQAELSELNRNRLSLRDELGDEAFDQYLYSSGQSNRVKVNSVMSGSPAESIGIQSGDIILSYDGKKVLNWQDIRKLTAQGDINTYTNLDIMRNDSPLSLMVPRGPLGVQLDAVRVDPQQ